MSKLTKRIKKNFKNPRNILVVGDGFGFLDELCDNFGNVFIISTLESDLKKRNLIYKENFEGIEFLPDLDVIFMNRNQDINLNLIKPLLLRYHPVIFVEGDEIFGRAEYKFLQNFNYGVIERFGIYHIWMYLK